MSVKRYLLQIMCMNHRIPEARRDLWRSSSQTHSCLKQCQLAQAAQDHIHLGYECLQEWKLHSIPGQPVAVFDHLHSKKLFFLCLNGISHI